MADYTVRAQSLHNTGAAATPPGGYAGVAGAAPIWGLQK